MTYIVREHINSEDPTAKGTELKRFEDWEEAKEYSDKLWNEDKIKSYVSNSEEQS